MNIYIMRHGETKWNREGRIQGSSDIALTAYGVELAEITGDGFCRDGISFDRIYSSPMIRAATTARIIADKTSYTASGKELYFDDRLREMCFGKYEGLKLKEIRQYDENIVNCFSKPSLYVPDPTGETYEEVIGRIDDFMDRELVPLEFEPDLSNVLVICHGTVIRAFLRRIKGISLDDFWNLRQPNCCVNLAELKNGDFTLLKENILYYDSEEMLNRPIM
ncbi:MAG: histidine phosphatase family protein [Lachnospiraceae bacterium]|nr:histidine phosphatase family protein [Lachnospiraceae bacterium]